MGKMEEIYADGIQQIHFVQQMVYFDLMTLQPEQDGVAPVRQQRERIIMPLQGFLRTFDSTQQLIDKLVDGGVLQKNQPTAKEAAPKKETKSRKKKTERK